MDNQKSELETTEGYYVGKEFGNTGSKKDGTEYTRHKIKFKPKLESEKGFSFTVFSPLKARNTKQLDELKEGQRYKVLFSKDEYTNKQGILVNGKTAIGFYSPSESVGPSPIRNAAAASIQVDLATFDEFKGRYLAALKAANIQPNPVHMLGSFIASNGEGKVAEMVEKCKEALK